MIFFLVNKPKYICLDYATLNVFYFHNPERKTQKGVRINSRFLVLGPVPEFQFVSPRNQRFLKGQNWEPDRGALDTETRLVEHWSGSQFYYGAILTPRMLSSFCH